MGDKSVQANQFPLVVIVLICVVPLLAAWLLYTNPDWISGTTNNGNLILPAVNVAREEFTGLDYFSKNNIDEFKGRWVLIHMIHPDFCKSILKDALDKTKRIRLMLDKDVLRTRRLLVVSGKIGLQCAKALWKKDQTLIRVHSNFGFFERISTIIKRPLEPGMVFLMDPLGNLMMWYEPRFNPYAVKKDLKRLLRVSQIG